MPSDPHITSETLEKAVKALAVAAVTHGPEAMEAFDRILKIQEEHNKQTSLLAKAKALACKK